MIRGDRDQLLAGGVRGGAHLVGDLGDVELGAEVVLVDDRLHPDQVDDPAEVGLLADRQLDRDRPGAEAVDHRLDGLREVGADPVHLVDVGDPRHAVAVGLPPDGLALRLHAGDGVEHGDGAVEHPQAALHLDREVHVPRGVDDVDAVIAPEARRRGARDGDAALLLLRHPVHRGRAVVDLADPVRATGVVEDPLGGRRLAGIDVGHDADVAGLLERDILRRRRHAHSPHPFVIAWPLGLAPLIPRPPTPARGRDPYQR